MIAGTQSGCGKTTVATGLMAALSARGVRVGPAKAGPDFIDPGYHSLATNRPGRNLDAWICGPDAMASLAARAGHGSDVLIIEGVMGLFDGTGFDNQRAAASTAELAVLLDAPVVLVIDASSMSSSVAAVVHGFFSIDPTVKIAGVILNKVASDNHEHMLRAALEPLGARLYGVLRRDPDLRFRDRHLGLVPVAEQPQQVNRSLAKLALAMRQGCDLPGLMQLANSARSKTVEGPATASKSGTARVAVGSSESFTFLYRDNLEALEQAGAEIVVFDPCRASSLPPGAQALYVGGGYPEVFAQRLSTNKPLLRAVRRAVDGGLPTWVECGGMLWLSQSLDSHPMAGCLAAHSTMTDQLTLGYRTQVPRRPTPLARAGTILRGHEFHYSRLDPPGSSFDLEGRTGPTTAGYATPSLHASYVHLHLGGDPRPAERFVALASATGKQTT